MKNGVFFYKLSMVLIDTFATTGFLNDMYNQLHE